MRSPILVVAMAVLLGGSAAAGQTPAAPSMERIGFDEAVRRAVDRNPSIAQAAAGILRAEAVLAQVRANTRPSLNGNVTTTVIGPVQQFAGASINPRTQVLSTVGLAVPLLTPVEWARRTQAGDQVMVAERTVADMRREVAIATAQAYLEIITQRRVLELNERARDTARAHYEYAHQRFEGGLGSRLNELRAEQQLSSDEARVEEARLAIRRAQEALGVLVAAEGPVDAEAEPAFEVPDTIAEEVARARPDLQLVASRQAAAERVARDSWRDSLPSVTGLFDPQLLTPSGLFLPSRSWSARLLFSVPLFDAGQRRGLARERESQVNAVRAEREGLEREARAELRTAREAVASTERALASARAAAAQAEAVVRITDAAFRAGATTNLEVIDAQRQARDADTTAAIAEDALRRARLELLVAAGLFPR
jgi:outer membrane protein TolC